MEAPTEIVVLGPIPFADWVKNHMDTSSSFSYKETATSHEQAVSLVKSEKPRALFVDLASFTHEQAMAVGIAAQRAFQWVSLLFVFDSVDEDLLKVSKSIRRRKWSIVGKPLLDTIGIDRVLAGVLTKDGLQDLSLVEFETELSEKASEATGDSAEDEDEEEAA